MRWLNNLRNKPKSVRRHIANVAALVICGVIFLIWALTLPYRFSGIGEKELSESLKPFAVLKDAMSSTFENTKESFKQF